MRVYSGRDLSEGVEQQFVITAVGGVTHLSKQRRLPCTSHDLRGTDDVKSGAKSALAESPGVLQRGDLSQW